MTDFGQPKRSGTRVMTEGPCVRKWVAIASLQEARVCGVNKRPRMGTLVHLLEPAQGPCCPPPRPTRAHLRAAGGDNKCQFWCRKRPGDIFADVFDAGSAAAAPGGTPAAVAAAAAAGAAGGLGDGGGVAGGGGGGMFGLGAGAGLLGPGAGGAAGAAPGLFGGPLQGGPAGTPAYGVGAAGGTGAAAARPNVIPGIGAALEGLTTANLQVRLRL